jgi:hypothetical protein
MNNQLTNGPSVEIKNQVRYLNIFSIGLLIYSVAMGFGESEYVSVKIAQAFQSIGLLLMIVGSVRLVKFKLTDQYLKVVFTLYFIWLISIVVRGIKYPINYDVAKGFLFSWGLIYFTPLVLLFPKNFAFYKQLFDVVIIFGISYLFLDIIFIKLLLRRGADPVSQDVVEFVTEISLPVGFIMLTYFYHSTKRNLLSIGVIVMTLLITVIRARRGLIFIASNIIVFTALLYFFHSRKKILFIYLTIFTVLLGILYASNLYRINDNKIFSFLAERGGEDTRTGVELYFYDDMKRNDWIVGKGMNGTYYCPDVQIDQLTDYRSEIETGYLQLILKGGLINLGLLLLIAIPASVNGIFFSKNILSKAAGIWILLFIINLYPQNAVSFNLSYILVWISVGICFSSTLRKLTDEDIQNKLLLC